MSALSEAGLLQGIRVVDLAEPPGQYSGRLLADLGADVVKVEQPGGDQGRRLAPFTADEPPRSLVFDNYNTNKRSLCLDTATAAGQAVLERLLAWADVWIETCDLAPEGAAAMAVDLTALREQCPRAILVSLRGFGAGGPYEEYHPTSLVLFAMSGVMHDIGPPEGPPVAPPGQLAYDLAAVDAASGTLMALLARRKTGRGQRVEVAALEVLGMQMGALSQPVTRSGGRHGNRHVEIAPSGVYECSDGSVEIAVIMPTQWAGLKDVLGHPPELEGAWDDREYRRDHAQELADFVAARLRAEKRMKLVERAQRSRLPCLPVNTVADFVADAHLNARGYFKSTAHLGLSYPLMPGPPFRYSVGGWRLRRPAPGLGEHSREILAGELHYSESDIDRLIHDGVVLEVRPKSRTSSNRLRPGTRQSIANEPSHSVVGRVPGRWSSQPYSGGAMTSLPLDGVRVVSFSTAYAGPTTSRYLADYGAEVIKVESLRRSDNTRYTGLSRREPSGVATSPQFQNFNRNKRGIAIDLSHVRGRELMRALVQRTDVVTENFSGRVMTNWGMDYDSLRQIRPDIIVLDMQGLGQTGPWKDFITFGSNLHSYAALTSVWGYSHSAIVDYMSAHHAVFSVLAALLHREMTGEGTHIEFGQVEVIPAMLGTVLLDYFANGTEARKIGNASPSYAPHGCYACQGSDAWCVVAVTNDQEWQRLCCVLDRPDWLADSRLAASPGRVQHAADLDAGVQAWTIQRRAREVEEVLQAAGVPAAAVRTRSEMDDDPHLRARGFITSIDHPVLGTQQHVGLPIHLSDTPGRTSGHAPMLGQDNEYVFGEILGLSRQEISDLTAQGVLT